MAPTNTQKEKIIAIICATLRNKFAKHTPEPAYMPFHTRLLGKDRLALYSFIHSLSTTFGTTIFEPVAEILAKDRFLKVQRQFSMKSQISSQAQNEIQKIMNALTSGESDPPNKKEEIEKIRKVCRSGTMNDYKTVNADLYLESDQGIFLIDIKTAKPNMSNFKDIKRTLLEWVAMHLAKNPEENIGSLIAIPYNPYAPKKYERWTMRGLLDFSEEIKVAEEFWDFLGGKNSYEPLLDCFEKAGKIMREEIDAYFTKFK